MNKISVVDAPSPIRPRPPSGRRAGDFLPARPPEPMLPGALSSQRRGAHKATRSHRQGGREAAGPGARSLDLPCFEHDVIRGLRLPQKAIPSTWLFDRRGCELFEQITQLDADDSSRSEARILERCAGQIAEAAGAHAIVVELGGASLGSLLLLAALDAPQACLPVGLAAPLAAESAAQLASKFTGLRVLPVVADFTRLDALPELAMLAAGACHHGRRIVLCPSSAMANFAPDELIGWLTRIGHAVGPDALLVVGADTTHDPAVLIAAHADRESASAAFSKNLLTRINRELGAAFSLSAFRHEARFDATQQRVETHLVSRYTQRVSVCGRPFRFAMGESIHIGNAYKYSLPKFQQLAASAGWSQRQLWMDGRSRFAVHVLEMSQAVATPRERNVIFR